MWCDVSPSMYYRSVVGDVVKIDRVMLFVLVLVVLLTCAGEHVALLGCDY